jgi:hypothetical protein
MELGLKDLTFSHTRTEDDVYIKKITHDPSGLYVEGPVDDLIDTSKLMDRLSKMVDSI